MKKNTSLISIITGLLLFPWLGFVYAELTFGQKVTYQFRDEPIDVVIPAIEKDLETLDLCIEGIRKNCKGVRDIYVISQRELTSKARWFSESLYPFSKQSVASAIFNDPIKAEMYLAQPRNRVGWVFQQLLKLYAPFVIPGISSNVLVVDSDTIFLNPTEFVNAHFEPLFNPGKEYHAPYFEHARKLIPGFKRVNSSSGISHHMLLQRPVLEYLFDVVRTQHGVEFWKAFCQCIDSETFFSRRVISPASEFEIYYNFMRSTSDQAHVRKLNWKNVKSYKNLKEYGDSGYNYVSAHAYMRKKVAPRKK